MSKNEHEPQSKRRRRGRPPNEAQAKRILDAAEAHLSIRGVAGLRMQALADELGVNKALLFHYFGSKTGLYEAVLARLERELDGLIESTVLVEGSAEQQLHALVDAYWSFLSARPTFARVLLWGYLGDEPSMEQVLAGNRRRYRRIAPLLLEATGDRARARHGYLSLLGAMMFYWTNQRTVSDVLGRKPDTKAALAQRRAHLHDLVDGIMRAHEAE